MIDLKRILKYSVYALALLPLLNLATTSIAIALFVLGSIIEYRNGERKLIRGNKEIIKILFWFSLPFMFYIISLIWTENVQEGISFINRSWALIIVSFVVFVLRPFNKMLHTAIFIRIYILSSGFLALLLLGYLSVQFYVGNIEYDITSYMSVVQFRKQINELPFFNEHPIYITLLLGTAIIFLFFYRFKSIWATFFLYFIMVSVVFLASSRGPLAALILVLGAVLFLSIKNKKKATLVLLLFFVVVGVGGYYSPLKSRVLEIVNTKHLYPKGVYYNSFNLRMGIYKCGFEIASNAPWYGYGAGDVQDKLNDCYRNRFDTNAYEQITYNTHNQYLFYWISFGWFGLLIILLSYAAFLRKAVLRNDKMYFFFLTFFFLSMLTENILSRNTGIVLFSMFNSILYNNSCLKNDNN